MLKTAGLLGRKKTSQPFKDYYADWFNNLKNSLLPRLRCALHESSVAQLSTHVEITCHHFQSYYDALDLAAADDAAQLLCPDWRNPIESPFLWLGDLHPYLFTNLLRSFFDEEQDENDDAFKGLGGHNMLSETDELFNRPWHIVMAWTNRSKILMTRIEQIECRVRLMVPALVARARKAQAGFVETVAEDWARWYGGGGRRKVNKEAKTAVVGKALRGQMDEMVGVLVDANRLRRSVLTDIIGAATVYQAALFLEGLAQFLVGFREPDLLAQFEQCKTPLNKLGR